MIVHELIAHLGTIEKKKIFKNQLHIYLITLYLLILYYNLVKYV